MHTTSSSGSYSRVNCKYDPGYSCTYYKRIQAIVTLNAPAYDFNNNVGGVRDTFLAAMAAAANVTTNHVTINGVITRAAAGGGSRRLFSVASRLQKSGEEPSIQEEFALLEKAQPQPSEGGGELPAGAARQLLQAKAAQPVTVSGKASPLSETGIRVFATVANAGRLNHLEHKLQEAKPGLFISHRWERHSTVKTEKNA